jgi:hypothetical protein
MKGDFSYPCLGIVFNAVVFKRGSQTRRTALFKDLLEKQILKPPHFPFPSGNSDAPSS